MSKLWRKLRFVFRSRRFDGDLEEEMRFHLEMKARAKGGSDRARYAAQRQFGNTLLLTETSREMWGWGPVDRLWRDLRYGVRMLAKNPSFTIVAVLTLAVGVGVNTAIFTAFNAVILRPIQAPEPSRLVQIGSSTENEFFSYLDYIYYRDSNRVFSGAIAITFEGVSMTGAPAAPPATTDGIAGLAGFDFPQPLTSSGSEHVMSAVVSGNYFKVLKVDAAVGRTFLPEEDAIGAQPVVMLSDNFWERRFARDRSLLGRSLMLNGTAFTVIGITPHDFLGTAQNVPDTWVPLSAEAQLAPDNGLLRDRGAVCCRMYARLLPGVERGQAEAQMNTLSARLRQMFPETGGRMQSRAPRLVLTRASPFGEPDAGAMAVLVLVLAAVSLVLLIACANVASLLLARSAARQKEIAIRLAIGASRGRLVRQLLTESALMSMLAGGIGLVLAWWSLRFLLVQVAASLPTYWGTIAIHVTPDHRVFAYLLLLALGATAAFGLAPALEASKPNLTSALKEEGAAFGGRLRKSRLRDVLVGTQVAVSLVLLIAAGLMARGSLRAFTIDLGFDYRNVVSFYVGLAKGKQYEPAKMAEVGRRLMERIEGLPGVTSVAVASRVPLAGGNRSMPFNLDGRSVTDDNAPEAYYTLVTPAYFDTLGIPIVRGRNFTPQELRDHTNFDGAPVIVSEATAHKFWPGQEPIGKRIAFDSSRGGLPFPGEVHPRSASSVVIGVAKDVRSLHVEEIDETCVYLPARWGGIPILRTRGDPKPAIAALRRELPLVDGNLEALVEDYRTAFTNQAAFVLSRVGAIGSTILGILGLLMAAVGIYGMVGFAVSQRTHEVGIRMALGAHANDVLELVLRETMRPVTIGIAAGLVAAAGLSRVLVSLLFGLSTFDPITFAGVSTFLLAVALVAGYIPARRATKVDPMEALRYE
jgi:macrolide transport system ATP-binding/permease protein